MTLVNSFLTGPCHTLGRCLPQNHLISSVMIRSHVFCGSFFAVTLSIGALLSGCNAAPSRGGVSEGANSKTATAPAHFSRTALDDYIARAEPAFSWRETGRKGAITTLELTSQQWHDTTWKHRVDIIEPAENEFPGRALLMISYGAGTDGERFFGQLAANAMKATLVYLWDVPNQPIFEKREDDLIAHTFVQYLQSEPSDATWPLLLPMTKSVTQAVRAVGEWSQQEEKKNPQTKPLTEWVFSGASKRGWTTWLAAAALNTQNLAPAANADQTAKSAQTAKNQQTAPTAALQPRVAGIIPIVYDNLDLAAQMPHQLATWGRYSAQIDDYTKRGLPDLTGTARGRDLINIVDPFVYRARFTMPILAISGANDPYWPLDAFNLYREALPGRTNVYIAPNAGHALGGQEARVAGISVAWFRALAKGQTPPQISAALQDEQGKAIAIKPGEVANAAQNTQWQLQVLANPEMKVQSARVWVATSATRDFRQAKWQSIKLAPATNAEQKDEVKSQYTLSLSQFNAAIKAQKYGAAFGEITIQSADAEANSQALGLNLPFDLSSPVIIWQNPR